MHIIYSKRRTLSIEIDKNAHIIIRAPLRTSQKNIAKLLQEKKAWIARTCERMQTKYRAIKPKQYINGENFFYLGKNYPLNITSVKEHPLHLTNCFELSKAHQNNAKYHFECWYKKQAKKVITERADYYALKSGLCYSSLRITSAKKRWGSCSGNNALSFTWRLIMTPLSSIDYVIAHELAHIIHKNHSKKFWNKVADIFPDYRSAQRWLYDNEHFLQLT